MTISTSFLGIRIDEMESQEAIDTISAAWATGHKQRVSFVNAHCVNIASRDAQYRQALAESELVLADGSGVLTGARLLGAPLKHNLNGTDLGPRLCARAAREGRSVFLLGGQPGVAEQAAARLVSLSPGLRIAGIHPGFFKPEDEAAILAQINAARPDMLLVALGVPRQELWIAQHWEQLDVGAALAVGALFDFLAERFKRAPAWMRRLGIEWTFRLIQEPGRLWKRYLIGNLTFECRVLLAAMNPASRRAARQSINRPAPIARPVVPAQEPALSGAAGD